MSLIHELIADHAVVLAAIFTAAGLGGLIATVAVWPRLLGLESRLIAQHREFSNRLATLERRTMLSGLPAEAQEKAQTSDASPLPPSKQRQTPQARAAEIKKETTGPTAASGPVAKVETSQVPPVYRPATASGGEAAANDQSAKVASESSSTQRTKRTRTSMEERLGTRVFIWVGGIAMVLAGLFLLKYSFDNQLLSPTVRVLMGAVFGVALLGAGEWMRKRSARIGEALAGAGVADLFGCLLAATTLYHLLGSTAGFLLMALVTALAVGLSLRHGAMVALLGLIGGFATPALIGGDSSSTFPLLLYLLLLEVGMTVVSRRRGWVGLTSLTLVGALVWAVVMTVLGHHSGQHLLLDGFLIGSAAVYVLGATGLGGEDKPTALSKTLTPMRIGMMAVGSVVMFVGVLVGRGRFDMMDFAMLGLLDAGVLVLARLRPTYGPMAWLAGVVSGVTLMVWVMQSRMWFGNAAMDAARFAQLVAMFGLLFAAGSYGLMWRSQRAGRWAAGSATAGVCYLLISRFGLMHAALPTWFEWWYVGGAATIAYALAALPVRARRQRMMQGEAALGALVVASGTLAAVTIWMGLAYPWMVGGWALLTALAAAAAKRERIAGLEVFGAVLAAVATACAIVPGPTAMTYGTTPVCNALLAAYAVPAIGLGLAAWVWRDGDHTPMGEVVRLLCLIVGAVGVMVLVRQGFHRADVMSGGIGLYEWATYAAAALTMAGGLVVWARTRDSWPQRTMGTVLAAVGMAAALVGCGLLGNPLWRTATIGSLPVLNGLLYAYGVPSVLMGVLMWLARSDEGARQELSTFAGAGSLAMFFLLVTLAVRQGFHGQAMALMQDGSPVVPGLFEWATYSVIFLLVAHGLLWWGGAGGHAVAKAGGIAFAGIGIGAVILGAGIGANPLWHGYGVGDWPVVNGLLYAFGLPTVLVALLAMPARRAGAKELPLVVGLASLLLAFGLVSLEVRQAFAGSMLNGGQVTMAEWYTYSLVWIVLGIALVLAGIRFDSRALRYGSLMVMLLAIGKVFVLDTARLDDLYRVMSLFGLGMSLLGLGYLYQRFVFRQRTGNGQVVSEVRGGQEREQ